MHSFLEWLDLSEANKIPSDAIKIHLPKIEQTTDYTCGPASLRAIAGFFGVGPYSEKEFSEMMDTDPKNGTTPENIIKAARKIGLRAFSRQRMTLESLKSKLEKKIPVICALQAWGTSSQYDKDNSGHYVVAIGFDENKIYFEDPSIDKKARGFLSHKDFLERWHDKEADNIRYERLGIAIWKPDSKEHIHKKKKDNLLDSLEIK